MRYKKVISVIISALMIVLTCSGSLISFASIFVSDGDVVSCPGNTKVYTAPEDYNYAWLDTVIARNDSLAVTPLTICPVTDYPYSHTYKDFIEECNGFITLFDSSETAIQKSVSDILKTVYYTLVATGKIPDSNQEMRAFNESKGIVYPYNESDFTYIYTVITYSCLKNNLYKVVTDNEVNIVRGTTIEGAVVRFLSAVCNMSVPSTVDTIPGFSYLFTEKYVVDETSYPVSDNPSEEEVYYWVKLQAAQKAGYNVPATTKYSNLSSDQIEYVTYAYYASMLTAEYNVSVDPIKLKAALCSENASEAVAKLILISMLDNVSVNYSNKTSNEALFEMVLNEGFFALENEFYTDIYNYKIYVEPECEKVWVTSYPVAPQLLDGEIKNVSTYINGKLVKNNSTNAVDVSNDGATFVITLNYEGKNDTAEYVFSVIKTADAQQMNEIPQIDIAQPFSELSENIANIVNDALNSPSQSFSNSEGYTFENTLTTYSFEETESKEYTGSLFETYPTVDNGEVLTTDNILTTQPQEETTGSILANVAQTVKENPTVVAAPVGLIAVGASAGFLFYYRRKDDTDSYQEDND